MMNADYHAEREHISKSGLDLIHRCPALYQAKLDGLLERTETPAMRTGTLIHTAVLEPDALHERYAAFDGRRGTNAFKAFADEHPGCEIVKPAELEQAEAMRAAVMEHPAARDALADGFAEASIFWTDPETGMPCKCRPDWVNDKAGIVVDLKTTASAAPDEFARSVWKYRYHVQHPFYVDGCKAAGLAVRRFLFIAVEKTAPFLPACYELDALDVELGRQTYKQDLATMQACREAGDFPGYGDAVQPLALPRWAYSETMGVAV